MMISTSVTMTMAIMANTATSVSTPESAPRIVPVSTFTVPRPTFTSPNCHVSHSIPHAASTSATNPPYRGPRVRPVALNSCFSNFPNI